MGAELTDPFKQCCCAQSMKIENSMTMGNNTSYQFDDYLQSNIAWIVKIQAHWKAKIARMRYLKQREELRKK